MTRVMKPPLLGRRSRSSAPKRDEFRHMPSPLTLTGRGRSDACLPLMVPFRCPGGIALNVSGHENCYILLSA
jgi:hypothetical protein